MIFGKYIISRDFYNENDIFMTWSIQKLHFDPKFKSLFTEFWLGAFQGQVYIYSYWKTFFYTWDWCKYFDHWRSWKFTIRLSEHFGFCNADEIMTSGWNEVISGEVSAWGELSHWCLLDGALVQSEWTIK